MHNYDERCFGYADSSALKENVPEHHRNEAKYYTEANFLEYGPDQIQYLVSVPAIPELKERLDISIRVASYFDHEGRSPYPMYNTKSVRARHINLLYYKGHYAWIKNVHRLLRFISKNGHKLFLWELLGVQISFRKCDNSSHITLHAWRLVLNYPHTSVSWLHARF